MGAVDLSTPKRLCDPICPYDILWSYCITHVNPASSKAYTKTQAGQPRLSPARPWRCVVRFGLRILCFIKPWHQRALCRWVGRLASPSRQPFCAVIESSPSVAYNDIHRLLCMNSHSPGRIFDAAVELFPKATEKCDPTQKTFLTLFNIV